MELRHRKILEECLINLAEVPLETVPKKLQANIRDPKKQPKDMSYNELPDLDSIDDEIRDSDPYLDKTVNEGRHLNHNTDTLGDTAENDLNDDLLTCPIGTIVSTFHGLNMTGIKVDEKLKELLLKYRVFTPDMLVDIKSEIDLFRELPTRGPHAFKKFIRILKETGCVGEATALEKRELEWGVSPKKTFYKMSSRPLGFCLIINNENFPPPKTRYGSGNDAIALNQIFRRMNFVTEIKENRTASQMLEILKDFSKKDFSKVDCSIVIISTHGARVNNLDVVLGVDGKYFYKHIIYQLFNYDICETLRKKPKIFLFQCCRDEDAKVANGLIGESSDSVNIDGKDPKWSDMYIAHSCLPDEESILDNQDGTWFCQDLIEVFSQHYHEFHLDEMIQMANIKLMKRTSFLKTKQAIHAETFGLRGPIYFN